MAIISYLIVMGVGFSLLLDSQIILSTIILSISTIVFIYYTIKKDLFKPKENILQKENEYQKYWQNELDNNSKNNDIDTIKNINEEKLILENIKEENKKYILDIPLSIYLISLFSETDSKWSQMIINHKDIGTGEMIKIGIDGLLLKLHQTFSLNDIIEISKEKNLIDVVEKYNNVLQTKFISNNYKNILKENQKYAKGYNVFDVKEDAYLTPILFNLNYFSDMTKTIINNTLETVKSYNNNIEKFRRGEIRNNVDFSKDIYDINQEIIFSVLIVYINLALAILYIIALSREIDKFRKESELYNLFLKLKQEIHNDDYIIEKLYDMYDNLYKDSFSVYFDNEEFIYIYNILCSQYDYNSILADKNTINYEEKINEVNIEEYIEITDYETIYTKLKKEYAEKLIAYSKFLSFDKIIDLIFSMNKNVEITFKNIKRKKLKIEKDNILSGNLVNENQKINSSFDYSKITNGYEFERFIAELYSKMGYIIEKITPKSGDQGADIIAIKDKLKYVIQVKFYSKPVGNKAVQEVIASKSYYKANKMQVVTNNSFTKSAKELAKANDVILIDGTNLQEYIKNLNKK